MRDDAELLKRLRAGNEQAFSLLYSRTCGPVYRFALHIAGDSSTAEEVVQETFLVVIRNLKHYDPAKGSLLCWLLGIARNLARKECETEGELLNEDTPDTRADVLLDLTREEAIHAVREAISSLPAPYREAIVLCELEELDYRDAACVLGCPIGTVRSRLHRARILLASKLHARCCV